MLYFKYFFLLLIITGHSPCYSVVTEKKATTEIVKNTKDTNNKVEKKTTVTQKPKPPVKKSKVPVRKIVQTAATITTEQNPTVMSKERLDQAVRENAPISTASKEGLIKMISDLSAKLGEINQENVELRCVIEGLNQKYTEYTNTINNKNDEISAMKKQITEYMNCIKQTETVKTKMQEQTKALQEQINKLLKENQEKDEYIKNLEEALNQDKKATVSMKENYANLKKEVHKLEKELDQVYEILKQFRKWISLLEELQK